tara:strand:+ start:190 stop:468 length:279 start_codon:yes stop_codon:yes gene_type:complete
VGDESKANQAIEVIEQQHESKQWVRGLDHFVPSHCNREGPFKEAFLLFNELSRVDRQPTTFLHDGDGLLEQSIGDPSRLNDVQAVTAEVSRT